MAAKSPIENLTAAQQVQFFYVTFYGRPADPAGLKFWTEAVEANGILNVVKDFGNSEESSSLYGSLTTREKIAKMYLTTFGRESDPGGLDYWAGLVTDGVIPNFAEAVVHMYNAMAPVDQTAVQNRQTVADEFTTLIDSSPLLKAAFSDPVTSGKAGQTLATWMASVSADPSSVTAAQSNTTAVITNIALGKANTATPVFAAPVLPAAITEDGGVVSGKVVATDADNIPTVTQKLAYELIGTTSSKGNGVTVNANTGEFTYTPAANFNGADSFTVAVSDGSGGRTVKTIDLNVLPVNDSPMIAGKVAAGSLAVTEDTKATGTITASDVDVGDKLSYSVVAGSGPMLGKVEFADSASGAYSYTPNPNANGTDSFILQVSDGNGGADTVKVNVTIAAVNDTPKIAADSISIALTTSEDVAKDGSITASDVDGDTVTYAVATLGSKGSVVIDAATGKYTYTPDADKNGTDSFVLTASDGKAVDSITVNVTIAAENDAPKIAADSVSTSLSTSEDVAKAGSITASDVDGDKLTYAVASQGSIGSVSIDAATGAYTYTPEANKNGPDSFVLTVSDGNGGADSIKVNVAVEAVNDAPKIADSVASSLSTSEDITKAGSITATDIEGDTITYAVGSQGKIGTVSIDASTGVYTYAPAPDKNGTDSFVLTASDGNGGADSITVNVTVAAVNDPPKIEADSVSTALATTEDTAKTGSINATDVDGDSLTYAIASQGKLGTVSIDSATGSYTYTPKANENGSDSFVLSASDGKGGADSITVNVTIAAVNDAPVAADDTATVVGGNSVAVSVLANDKDADNDKLTIVSAVSTRGNVTINSDGTLTYKAMDGDGSPTGIPDSVIYTVSDGKGGTASATLTVNVVTRTGGSSGNDVLGGGTGNDIINALEGDDFVNGGGGLDRITAGDGNDTVVFSDEANFIRGGNDTDTLKLPVSGDFKFDLSNATNQYTGSTLNAIGNSAKVVVAEFEIIDGSAAQSGIAASAATAGSTVYGSSMADSLVGAAGNDYFDGGRGNDTLIGGGGVDTIFGGSGADSILGAGHLDGGSGADSITTNGAATVSGDVGNDYIVVGGSGSIAGGADNDVILTSGDRSGLTIDGGDGNDSIYSGSSADSLTLYGGSGADTISVDGLNDFVNGGDGNDYIALSTTSFASTASIHGGSGVDTLVLGDSAISADHFKNISGFESIIFGRPSNVADSVDLGASYTLNGNSVTAGLADLTTITIGGADSVGDSITLRNISQQVTINVKESYDAAVTSIDADSTTGSIVVVADSLGITDVLSLHGANDYFRDTVDGNTSYVFASGSGVEFIELTGKAVNATAAVSIVSGQSISLASLAAGDSVSLTVGLTNGGSGSADTVTVTGGARNDVLNLTGAEKATIDGGSGNDLITFSATAADSVVAYGGAGADTIYAGAWDTVYGDNLASGSGDDLIILTASADSTTYVDGGAGTDVVRIGDATTSSASLNRLVGIEGLDFLAVDMAMTLTGGGVSADFSTIYVDGDSLTFTGDYGGSNNISITLTNGSGTGDTAVKIIADSLSDLRITANSGIDSTDTINAGSETSSAATLDIITATVGKADTAVSFALDNVSNIDQLNIGRLSGATSVATVTVTAADSIAVTLTSVAADSLSLNLTADVGGMVTVTSGAGNDLIDFSSATKGNRFTETESISSADTVKADQAGDSVSDYVSTGAGSDSILIDARDTAYAGSGNDTIVSSTNNADTLNVLTIYADSGNDWISIDGAYDYVDAGDGNDRIVITSTMLGQSVSVIGGAGADTLSLVANSAGVYADSAFANVSGIEVLDLRNSGSDRVTLGAEADQAGIIRVLADAGDSINLVGMGEIQVDAAVASSGNFRLVSDSLTTVTLFADTGASFGSEDIIQLSTATGGDVLSIQGAASDSLFNLTGASGLDSVIVRGDVTRVVEFDGVGADSLGGIRIEAADTSVTLNVEVRGADSLTYVIVGSSGNDTIDADSGTLSVVGGGGQDSVVSEGGNDFIDLSANKNALDSGYISSGAGHDTLIAGAGNDKIEAGIGIDSVMAGDGNDVVIIIGSAADSVTRDYVNLGAGADSLLVSGTAAIGVDVYIGTGADSLTLSNKADFVYVDAADTDADVISAGSGSDYIDLRTTVVVSGTNVVDLGADSDQFFGGLFADSVHGQAGNDTIITGGGADTVYGGDGDDSISVGLTDATAGDSNYASGDAGNDTLIGGGLNDTLDGGAGNDSITGGDGADSINLGSGSATDWVNAGGGNDLVFVEDATAFAGVVSTVTGATVYDTLTGGTGSDTLSFAGPVTLSGFDNLASVSEFEVISISGSSGTSSVTLNDTVFDSSITLSFTGASSVSVVNSFVSESGTVTIQADTAVAALSVTGRASLTEILEVYASDSLDGDLSFNGSTGDKVIVVGQTDADAFSLAGVVVPTIELRGDTLGGYNLTYSTSQATGSMTVSLVGGVGADTTDVTWASASSDSINMSIFTQGGADSIITGSGADFISTGVGADTVQSGSGADTINAADGSNYTDAGAGDDSIVVLGGADTVFAGSGNDYLSIGNGANVVDLGTGRDSVYGGTGADSVFAGASDSVGDLYMLYGGADTVYAGSGADTIDVSAVAGDSADYVSSGGGNDSVLTGDGNDTVLDGAGYDSIWTGSGNDYVSFDSGADSVGTDYIYLGSGADTLIGSADSGGLYVTVDSTDTVGDIIEGGFSNDTIVAAGGADSILGGSGNDSILAQGLLTSADSMSDTVRGGFGADYIDLGLSGLGDTDYVIVGAGTLAGSQASDYEGLAADSSQESWAFSVDTVYNFDLWYGASDSLTYDILSFSWMDASVADSVAGDVGAVLKSGVISGFAENAVASQTDLQGALNTVETYASLTTGEVVAFKWQSNWYVAVAVADNQLGAVVRLAGIDDIDSIVGAAGGYYLKDLPGV